MENQQKEHSLPDASSLPHSYPPTQLGTPPYPSANLYALPPPSPYSYGPDPHGVPRRQGNVRLMAIIAGVAVMVLVGAIVLVMVSRSSSGQTPPNGTGTPGSTQVSQGTPQATGGGTQTGQPTAQPTAAPTPVNSPAGAHKVGDVVTIDEWQVTILGAKTSQVGQFDSLQPGNVFLEIDVSLVNQTSQTQLFASFEAFTLKDGTGQTYQQAFVSDAPAPPDGRVTAGGKLRGTVAYQVPSNIQTIEFDVTPNTFGRNTDVAVWNLSV